MTTSPSRVRRDVTELLARRAPLQSPRLGPRADLDANASAPAWPCNDLALTDLSQAESAEAACRTTSCRSQSAPALTER
ncbi:hypothetical protein ASE38_17230 [Cellulomonas sp. Root930]|nr:hypothetical protein ASE38_17230 [Cellulomonas sp. Root930]